MSKRGLRKIPGKSASDYLRKVRERNAAILKQVKVVSNAEAEEVDFVVCPRKGPSPFTVMTGVCSRCGVEVMFRWHAPRNPPKICVECATKAPGMHVTSTPKH
jgi:ribosomal protein L37E